MALKNYELTYRQMEKIKPFIPNPKASPKGGPKPISSRLVFEALL
jgi:hypothetical protein